MGKVIGQIHAVLGPCPFCGGQAIMKQTGKNRVVIQCQKCPARMEQRTLRNGIEWLVAELKKDWDMRH
jgi:transcription elongation factor Elf1